MQTASAYLIGDEINLLPCSRDRNWIWHEHGPMNRIKRDAPLADIGSSVRQSLAHSKLKFPWYKFLTEKKWLALFGKPSVAALYRVIRKSVMIELEGDAIQIISEEYRGYHGGFVPISEETISLGASESDETLGKALLDGLERARSKSSAK